MACIECTAAGAFTVQLLQARFNYLIETNIFIVIIGFPHNGFPPFSSSELLIVFKNAFVKRHNNLFYSLIHCLLTFNHT